MLEHLINRKPRISILGTWLDLYNRAFPGHAEDMRRFAQGIAKTLQEDVEIASIGFSTLVDQARGHVRQAEALEVDALLL